MHESLEEWFSVFRARRFDPRRSTTLAGIAVERELADQQDRLRGVGEGHIHDPFVVIEDAEIPQLVGHLRHDRFVVGMGEADQTTQAGPDSAHLLTIRGHPRLGAALNQYSHGPKVTLR